MEPHQKPSAAEFALSLMQPQHSGGAGLLASYRDDYVAALRHLQELLVARSATAVDDRSLAGTFIGPLFGVEGLLSWPGVEHALASSPYLVSVIERYPEPFVEMLEQCRHGVPDRSNLFRLRAAMLPNTHSADAPDVLVEDFMR